MMRQALRHVGLGLGVALWIAAPSAIAQESSRIQLSPAQMQEAAKLALRTADPSRAVAIADALLQRDPGDVNAHLIRAYALRELMQYNEAQLAARRAWRLAETDLQKYNAALVMAQALSSDDKRTRAQFWLRRAVQNAPNPGSAAQAERDFKYVRRRNPWQTYLSFTLAPNSNINNGSSRDSYLSDFNLFGSEPVVQVIGPEQRALSGLEIGAQVQSRYRFSQTERQAHDLRLGLSYRSYVLSDSSKADLPEASGSDYAYGTASIGYGFKHLREDRRGELSATLDLGQTFYAGARYATFLSGSLDQSYYLDQRTKLRFGLRAETENGQRISDSESVSLFFGVDRALNKSNGLHLGVTLTEQTSPNFVLEYSQIRVRAGYVLGRRIMRAQLQFGMGVKLRDYDRFLASFDGRRDVEVSFDVTATLKEIDYYGFNPQIRLTGARTNSTIGRYDSNRVGLSIGIVSAF